MPVPLVLLLALALAPGEPPPLVTLLGRVVDAQTREPVAGARVSASGGHATVAGDDGRFGLALERGHAVLRVAAPGYRSFAVSLAIGARPAEFVVPLERAPPRLEESLTVTTEAAVAGAPAPFPLARSHDAEELRALAPVAASDPLRAAQALPGVAANDEFGAGFAARGSGFQAAGVYVDGVRLSAPFHTIRDINDGYTLTIFNADVLESMALIPGGAPARYGDRLGAVLAVSTRPGRPDFHGRASVGAAGAFATLEGPLGPRASWLASARRSFLGYIVDRVDDSAQLALGWRDLTTRLDLRPRPAQRIALLALLGRARYENTEPRPGAHEMESAEAGTDLLHLAWHGGFGGSLAASATAFALRETADNRDTDGFQRFDSSARQAGLLTDAAWRRGSWRLEGGFEARHTREQVLSRRFAAQAPRVVEDYDHGGWQWGGFAQASWARPGGGLLLTAGGRVDHLGATAETVFLPRASLELRLDRRTRLSAGFGGYAQFPDLGRLYGESGNPALDAERSRHLVLALERELVGPLRLRLEAYEQRESGLVWNRELEYRLVAGQVVAPGADARLRNDLSGPSRGIELTLAATRAGPFSGFASYALAHARREDGAGPAFDSDFDQRHTVTAFVRANAGHGAALSTAFRYGSGFPFPGFLRGTRDAVFVAERRNGFGPAAYARWDLRGEKRFAWRRLGLSLYVEVANLLDRENERFNEIRRVDRATGAVELDRDTMLPLIPFFGLSLEF